MKRVSLQRKSVLQRPGRPLKQSRRRIVDREASEAWARGVHGKGCIVCGARPSQGHHVITQQALRRHAADRDMDAQRLLWDRRNRVPVCAICHHAHHAWTRRLPLSLVERHAPRVRQFARELGLEWLLDREYPAERRAA